MSSHSITHETVSGHVRALGLDRVDVGAIPQDDRQPVWHRCRTLAGVIRLIPWLRARNARGDHIYIRVPADGIVLVDDLSGKGVDQMRADGITPAAIVLTSPGNHQAWCRLPGGSVEPGIARAVCSILTRRYGGDRAAVGAGRAGRLPGFLNRKPQYRAPGNRFPWVRLVEASGKIIPEAVAADLIEEARTLLRRESSEEFTRPDPIPTPAGTAPGLRPLLAAVRGLRPAGEGRWTGCCPAHDDAHPSLSIRIAREGPHPGAILLHCHAGCDWRSVAGAAGVRPSDLFPQGVGS